MTPLSNDGTPQPERHALVVRHHVEDDAGLIGLALIEQGFRVTTVLVDGDHPSPDEAAADLVVMLGSNSSVYDDAVRTEWLNDELAFLAKVDATGVPIFGICFGAQELCALFGGTVERAPHGEMGWTEISVVSTHTLSSGPWFEYHHDHCVLPPVATLWATSTNAVQAFSIGRHVGVQFHPEIDDEQLARWFQSASDHPRAHSDHEASLLTETRRMVPAARQRARELVSLVVQHAFAVTS
jgi:GMP synthase-like glutamine amidotransferase